MTKYKINMLKSMPWQQKTTNLGLTVKLTALHTEVSKQIQNYPTFAKAKPPKKSIKSLIVQ
jgi:hypothetical protein